jgi:hypothetical protein
MSKPISGEILGHFTPFQGTFGLISVCLSSVLERLAPSAKDQKIIARPWPTPTLLRYSNKNKQYVAANTIRRPSYRHCQSDNAGGRVKNCTFIAVIE